MGISICGPAPPRPCSVQLAPIEHAPLPAAVVAQRGSRFRPYEFARLAVLSLAPCGYSSRSWPASRQTRSIRARVSRFPFRAALHMTHRCGGRAASTITTVIGTPSYRLWKTYGIGSGGMACPNPRKGASNPRKHESCPIPARFQDNVRAASRHARRHVEPTGGRLAFRQIRHRDVSNGCGAYPIGLSPNVFRTLDG